MITWKSYLFLTMAAFIAGMLATLAFDVSAGWEAMTVIAVLFFVVTVITWLFMRPAVFLPWTVLWAILGMLSAVGL